MASTFSPSPHVNIFGVHTEYGPVHEPKTPQKWRKIAAPLLGITLATGGMMLRWIRRA